MKKINLKVWLVGISVAGVVTCAQALSMKEGKWAMTVTTKMDGMSQEMSQEMAQAMQKMQNLPSQQQAMMQQMMGNRNMQMNANGMTIVVNQCVTAQNPVPHTNPANKGCKESHTIDGNTIHFQADCGSGHSSGDIQYEGNTMKGTIKGNQMMEGKMTNVTIDISGQYVGPCDK